MASVLRGVFLYLIDDCFVESVGLGLADDFVMQRGGSGLGVREMGVSGGQVSGFERR